jgi:hypothetical protein
MEIALVPGGDESLDVGIGREHPGRHSLGLRAVIGQRIAVHVHPRLITTCRHPPNDRVRPDRWYRPPVAGFSTAQPRPGAQGAGYVACRRAAMANAVDFEHTRSMKLGL